MVTEPPRRVSNTLLNIVAMVGIAAILAACGPSKSQFPTQDGAGRNVPIPEAQNNRERGSLFGGDFSLGGSNKSSGGGIGVNSFLWRASLDTVSFMPLQSADPFGGVIISDWYEDPASPGERFKVTIYILDQRLRADGIKVAVFRQDKGRSGTWSDAAVNVDTAIDIENSILTRARQLRIDSIEE